ncbi:EAL domain-containing protein [Grimontia sp. NTOU-MAR1]|uniref:EAL domain-containing protein n=1 Tax=Grimontia sp. NTOU-MAR1 TaxID=3111011 RepID=UPI002DBBD7A5|nr:EAL domain-containing protein [Grimontia sp. NTOU-MAR1]WRV99339.1 EAL domain-containing protein [Grimontia sp. NTOU-MAR1]
MFKNRLSLLSIYLTSVLVVALSSFAYLSNSISQQQLALENRASHLETKLQGILPKFIAYYDTESVGKIAGAVLSAEVRQITITDQVTSEQGTWSTPSEEANPTWFNNILSVKPIELTSPLIHEGRNIASLNLRFAPDLANKAVAKDLFAFITLFSISAGVLLALFTFTLSRNQKAVQKAASALDRLSEQDFSVNQLNQMSGIKRLDNSINNLSSHIQRMIQSLHKELKTLNNGMMYDAASGLPNRQFFIHQLNSWMGDDEGVPGAVVIANMSWLDTIYRRYGYAARDETWRLLSTSLQSAFSAQPNICVARISETEIALILPECSEEQSRNGLHTLISTLNNEVTMAGFETNEGFHVGVVHGHGLPGTQLLSLADNALQRAIRHHEVFVFNRGSEEQVIDRETWRSLLDNALKKKAVRLLSQPVYCLFGDTTEPLHSEVFTQANIEGTWQSGGRLIPYIQLFEKGVEFDRVVVEQLVNLHEIKPITQPLALNLTDDSLENRQFISWLQNLLKSELPAENICFEISEASARNNLTACISFSEAVRQTGATIGIDHFGRYLQEVEYLSVLKPGYVKLDQALSQNQNAQNRVFTETLANIADSQNITVIATGVKDDESKAKINADFIGAYQGFIHPPVPITPSEQTA